MIVYACTDLIFASKVGSTAKALNVGARPTRNSDALQARLDQVDDGKLNEPVTGVIVDLGLADTAMQLIHLAKSHHAQPTVVAFGSHVDTDALRGARDAGADFVMPRSAFTQSLPELVERLNASDTGR